MLRKLRSKRRILPLNIHKKQFWFRIRRCVLMRIKGCLDLMLNGFWRMSGRKGLLKWLSPLRIKLDMLSVLLHTWALSWNSLFFLLEGPQGKLSNQEEAETSDGIQFSSPKDMTKHMPNWTNKPKTKSPTDSEPSTPWDNTSITKNYNNLKK